MPILGLGGGCGCRNNSNCKPAKTELGDFDPEIILDTYKLIPGTDCSGSLRIDCNQNCDLKVYGIRIQLDGLVKLRFQTKNDNRLITNVGIESIFQGSSSEPKNGQYFESPFRQQILGDENDDGNIIYAFEIYKNKIVRLEPGKHEFQFHFRMPSEPLPAPFKTTSGWLTYKIVAYMRSPMSYVQVAEKVLQFRGYNNIILSEHYLKPLEHKVGFSQSLFSSKKSIKAFLKLDHTGFLPGETIQFQIGIQNPKLFLVRKVNVNLIRRICYTANKETKTTSILLNKFETGDEANNDPEIQYSANLVVPKDCVPSFTAKPLTYTVRHLINYQIRTAECPGPLKGEVDIIIGTDRDFSIPDKQVLSTINIPQLLNPPTVRSRSRSVVSGISEAYSVMSLVSLPPAYSLLSSRAASMTSLQTLPPHYDDLKNTDA